MECICTSTHKITEHKMEFTWQLILLIYIFLAFALYGIFHWIEVVLGNENAFHDNHFH